MDIKVDAEEIISDLSMQVADKTRENAILKAQVNAYNRRVGELQEELARSQSNSGRNE